MKYLAKNFTQIPNELFQAQTLDLRAIGLYAYLSYRSYSGNALKAFPSQKRIMKDLKIGSDTTLRKIIRQLEKHDFLIVKRGSIWTGNSQYSLQIPNSYVGNTS